MDRQTQRLKDFHDILVGQPLDEAIAMNKEFAPWITVRVVRRDGQPCIVTRDFKPNRVNVAADGSIITSIISIG